MIRAALLRPGTAPEDSQAKARVPPPCNIHGPTLNLLNRYKVSLSHQAAPLMMMLQGSVHPLANKANSDKWTCERGEPSPDS